MQNTATPRPSANAAAPLQKPIRFVTNTDGPYAKRRRINSACLTCRRKKTRCSGERPVCGTCKQNKHECAGYGADADATTTTTPDPNTKDTKDSKKQVLRDSNPPTEKSIPKNVRPKQEPPLPSPVPSRQTLHHGALQASPNLDSSSTASVSNSAHHAPLSLSTRNRMPFFRYFGPTAIMPGFKQMVVKVRGKAHSTSHTSSDALESSPGHPASVGSPTTPGFRTPVELPVYDTSTTAPPPLITHLCKLFMVHFGCTFPFLQPERFLRDLEEKQVDAILVDAVCALAARFSTHPLLTGSTEAKKEGESWKMQPHEYGQAFAQRAKSAIPDAFHCPSVAVVQAALLLAYDEFGASRDSGLWMYLGIAIRMAQDLGMQTLEGLKYEGRDGPTPKSVKTDPNGGLNNGPASSGPPPTTPTTTSEEAEQRAVERERLDTFWSIFFLDRVISSGTGRPVTLRDRDIEISFPSLDEVDLASGWPLPFPALIRIIHLYGRVTDLLNRIKEKAHITEALRKQLDTLEFHLTEIYQGLSPKLHFNAVNFQHYVKIKQGTNFLLLHCWFHTLIVLLHQPTLLKTFEGSAHHLSSNSRELSMSSAKTVADILAFTDLIDAKTGVGNPFTSQPIYIVACAFLKETALHTASSQPHSRPSTPGSTQDDPSVKPNKPSLDHMDFDHSPRPPLATRTSYPSDHDQKQAQKHTLLASAANQNYQRCYRALKSLETYWAGVKYILTVLDQKAKGVGDPLLYTAEEVESALEQPKPEPDFTSPGWRRKLSWGAYLTPESMDTENPAKVTASIRARTPTIAGSPLPAAGQAIGWSLTGTMNSPSTNVAVMYPSDASNNRDKPVKQILQPSIASILSGSPAYPPHLRAEVLAQRHAPPPMPPPQTIDSTAMPPPPTVHLHPLATDPSLISDADLLLNLHTNFNANPSNSLHPTTRNPSLSLPASSFPHTSTALPTAPPHTVPSSSDFSPTSLFGAYPTAPSSETFGDMVIDSQDVDMSALGAEMMPWDLEYLPHDLLFYGEGAFGPVEEEPGSGSGEGDAETG